MTKTPNSQLPTGPILLFDGPCNLCNKGVQFFLSQDKKGLIHFASLQSKIGQELLKKFSLPLTDHDSLVLIEGNRYWLKTDAIIKASTRLGGFYRLLAGFKIIPLFIRDFTYSQIANNRYKWFGKQDTCFIPNKKYTHRFLN